MNGSDPRNPSLPGVPVDSGGSRRPDASGSQAPWSTGQAVPYTPGGQGAAPHLGNALANATGGSSRPPAAYGTGGGHATNNLPQGLVLGKYQIVRQLGSGGMGAVYEAVHTSIGKTVALKTMNPALTSDPRAEARFMREAAAASRLGHPNVCDVTDFGSDQGVVYIVMEILRGEDLSSLISHAPAGLDASFVADVMLAVCAGVFAAHEKGVVHRDLKPQNIFLSRTPLGDVVPKVLDFGISKLLDEDVAGGLTNSGSVMGTTHYLSPEQVTGMPVDGRSDEFALGVILYECLTGQRPHQGDTIFTIMRAISEGRFTRPRALRPDVLPAMESVILRAMAIRPEDRYPTVHEMGNGLLPFASQKGRMVWGDYFAQPPAPTASVTGGAPAGTMATPSYPVHAPGATMLMGPPRQFSGDTRSGVGPVSVIGTNELPQQPESRGKFRGMAFALVGAAVAAVAVIGLRPGLPPAPVVESAPPSPSAPSPASIAAPTIPVPPPPAEMPAAVKAQAPAPTKIAPDDQAPAAVPPAGSTSGKPAARVGERVGSERAAALAEATSEAKAAKAAKAANRALADDAEARIRRERAERFAQTRTEAKAKAARTNGYAREAAPPLKRPAADKPAAPRPRANPRLPTDVPDRENEDLVDGPRIATPHRAPILD